MHRFFLAPEACREQELLLPPEESHHAAHVLRVRVGDRVVVLDGAGLELLCEVVDIAKRSVRLTVQTRQHHAPAPCQITLLQAVTRAKTMDLILQKATELGAHRVVPILSERTVAQFDEEAAGDKVEKYEATVIEAMKQCGSPWRTRIERPLTTSAFLARAERFELAFLASLQPGARHPRHCFVDYYRDHRRRPQSMALWIGPEGDFTPAEIHAINGQGALPISLGPLVLRSETAAIYGLSILNYEIQAGL